VSVSLRDKESYPYNVTVYAQWEATVQYERADVQMLSNSLDNVSANEFEFLVQEEITPRSTKEELFS